MENHLSGKAGSSSSRVAQSGMDGDAVEKRSTGGSSSGSRSSDSGAGSSCKTVRETNAGSVNGRSMNDGKLRSGAVD